MSVNIYNAEENKLAPLAGSSSYNSIVTSWEETPSDIKIPSEKLVKDSLDNYIKQDDFDKGQISATICTKNSVTTIPITFNKTFNSEPIVVATMVTNSSGVDVGNMTVSVMNITTTGATLYVYNNGATDRKPAFNWIAM